MLFSSLIFLYAFLPIVLITHYFIRKKYRNRLLLTASLIFFAWGGVTYSLLIIFSLLVNYFTGLLIHKWKNSSKAKTTLIVGVIINLLMLGIFKYANFITENINYVISLFSDFQITNPGIILPLGISFYTFQAMSYIIDLYRGEADVQKNFFKLSLYISFFPQLIAGPIVRYQNIAAQLTSRKVHKANLTYGIQRFVVGLSKKVLLANQFAIVADKAYAIPIEEMNTPTAWVGVLAYTFQIYFDFSGYSDMAIGLGRMFGFKLPENFNFPYISRSIREFWTRWHMTLSVWFKNYLYFPLGGSRKGQARTIGNLLLVFFATSIWHGASWNFVIWGMTHGFFMMLERLGLGKILEKTWRPFQHIYALLIISVTRVFFRADTLEYAWPYFKKLFSFNIDKLHIDVYPLVHNNLFYFITIVGILSSTPFWNIIIDKLRIFANKKASSANYIYKNFAHVTISFAILIALFLITMFLASNSYNPFIYFRF
jgi:alginate O-acetyltransferase complex protein AlgI